MGLALGTGLLLTTGFVVLQRRLDHPLVDVDTLMGSFALRSALSVQLLLYMNAFSSIFMLSIYMQVSLGRSAATAVLAGMLVTAMLISHSIGNDPVAQHPLTFVETMLTAFWLLAALSVLALGVSLTPRTRARG